MINPDDYEGHTPGPWFAKHDLVETEAKYGGTFTHIINSNGWRVWLGESDDINDEPKDVDTTVLDNSRFGHKDLGEIDARLIADAPLLLAEVERLREALITVQRSLIWDEKDRAMDGDPITLEALVAQVEEVRSDITEMIE